VDQISMDTTLGTTIESVYLLVWLIPNWYVIIDQLDDIIHVLGNASFIKETSYAKTLRCQNKQARRQVSQLGRTIPNSSFCTKWSLQVRRVKW